MAEQCCCNRVVGYDGVNASYFCRYLTPTADKTAQSADVRWRIL
jgi:hypothetical protein